MEIFKNIKILDEVGVPLKEYKDIVLDSRKASKGSIFVAISGTVTDGHNYIEKAIENGASAIVCEKIPEKTNKDVYYVKVKNTSEAIGILSSNYYDNPSKKIKLIGVTGTNGKTTIATLLYNLFTELGYFCGLISTVKNIIGKTDYPSTHTTPDVLTLNSLLAKMVDNGCEYCFMEVSSHAVVQKRIFGLSFEGGIFTNLSHDHLDYHKTYKNYINAKKGFFDSLGSNSFALTNIDDKNGLKMVESTKAKIYKYGLKNIGDFHARIIEKSIYGTLANIDNTEIWLPLPAEFNVYNLLAVYAVAELCNINKSELNVAITKIKGAPGRFEIVHNTPKKAVIVDYAHTPDALENILKALKEFEEFNRIICVFGAGGDRDKTKRPEMGEIVLKYADVAVITSDNPRTENPDSIIDDIMEGISLVDKKRTIRNTNRYSAIQTALNLMNQDDVVLIAGKGHETYQEINGVKHNFDDVEVVKELLQ
ncbi:MAG: UDP-N-acetylmuramoyl-L-alanyl-D-glutamate--2,6-diaminopimelate ligase [Bacteroidales bacterium]|jgi:UDP-N-acetylmuramoyl-L-alanyl-D-glutamate--2,6-diaminopimelate ligase